MPPSHCVTCGEWPASKSHYGLLCHLCYCRAICEANPVPLPSDPEMRAEIERLRSEVSERE